MRAPREGRSFDQFSNRSMKPRSSLPIMVASERSLARNNELAMPLTHALLRLHPERDDRCDLVELPAASGPAYRAAAVTANRSLLSD